jgi:hypothetical protein
LGSSAQGSILIDASGKAFGVHVKTEHTSAKMGTAYLFNAIVAMVMKAPPKHMDKLVEKFGQIIDVGESVVQPPKPSISEPPAP